MKKLIFAAAMITSMAAAAQKPMQVQSLIKESHQLNSGGHIGGHSRIAIPITLPPKTVAVFYTVQVAKRQMPSFIDLAAQIASALRASQIRTVANLLALATHVTGTVGDGVCDVMVFGDAAGAQLYVDQKKANTAYPDACRVNFSNGTVGIPIEKNFLGTTPLYIDVRNPSAMQAITVSIEVTAVVQ